MFMQKPALLLVLLGVITAEKVTSDDTDKAIEYLKAALFDYLFRRSGYDCHMMPLSVVAKLQTFAPDAALQICG